MISPAVSVIIPTYNHAQFLRAALQSVINQTFADWEAVVVNNYSEDDTVQIVASFNDPRIRLVNFRNHGVIAASRNHGIGLATGKTIAFLDSDDVWYREKLQRCMDVIGDQVDVVCHAEAWVKENAPPRVVMYGPQLRTCYLSLLYDGNCLSTSAIVVRKSALDKAGGFSEDSQMVTAEDYELWLRLAKKGCSFVLIEEVLGEYRLHGGNQSKAVMRNLGAELAVLRKHFSEIRDDGIATRLKMQRRFALAYYTAARGMQAEGDHVSGMKLLLRSWLRYPFIPKQYAAALIGLLGFLKPRGVS
ncbi:glycosyltransferase family 2 protein [Candidatus Ferrigenium straubiae]|jgi:glycosyltransferase involved in cell wall biosynthesis|uniref:glycosyltransferase family 2 protein n=1 Tax=Candidatus Ferrigenium straubiae TaxID=2919506 RepID=UPI003F4AE458